jgi:sugar phosphate permease
MGLMVVALWLGQSWYVPWLQQMLEIYDWRSLWRMIGLVIGLGLVPLIWLLSRDRPERFGLQPDGAAFDADAADVEDSRSWTLPEARRTVIFWVFTLGRTLIPAAGSSLMLHQVSVFAVLGHSPAVAAQTFGTVAVVAAIGSIFTGYLMDRLRPGLMMMAQLCFMLLTMLLAVSMGEAWMLPLYALSFGTAIAIGNVFDNVVWANLFGRKYLGEIRGYVTIFMTLGVTLGPILAGWCYDTFGDYRLIFIGISILALLQMILAYIAPQPHKAV